MDHESIKLFLKAKPSPAPFERRTDSPAGAAAVLERMGFSQIRVRPDYYADPKEAAVCMQKIVPQEENHV